MHSKLTALFLFTLCFLFATASDADAGRRVRIFGHDSNSNDTPVSKSSKESEKSFDELIKNRVKIEGLFDFYQDTTDNSMLMSIKPSQYNTIFLCGETRSGAEGAFFDNGSMGRSFPFYFKRIGKDIMMLEKNLRIRADSTASMSKALERSITDHLFASTPVKSKSQDSTEAILIDPADLFIRDAQNLGYFMSQAKMGMSFDSKNSYFDKIKSFPENSEIDVKLHYKTSIPFNGETMQNPYSMFHTFHYSLSSIPETDYVPRLADDRVGHFLTIYEDYSTLDEESPYVRFINRWNLKKKNPEARISEPVEPIVYWVENTVPAEYRDAVAEGIEFWNMSFEKIGFRNAIVAKQMPDTADWDPADVRYNTVRWIIVPGGGYAVGPSRANPFTGQIYDADVRVVADFIRYMYTNMEYFIEPLAMSDGDPEQNHVMIDINQPREILCNYASESAKEAAFGLTYLLGSVGDFVDKDSLTKEYVHSYLVELIAHEVGHTLGFRHNFKASTIYSLEQLQDRKFTIENSMGGTVMDYNPPNIAATGKKQGEFYPSVPGPYDDWVIEYAYSDFGAKTPEEELPQLKTIADKAADPLLVYGTDEDAFGSSPKGIDPLCFLFDQVNDPIAYCHHKVNLTRELWTNA
ncbi:MAG: zinc-dependent metalloprotease, partial [bacterium]